MVVIGWLAASLTFAEVSYTSDNWLFSEAGLIVGCLFVFGVFAAGVYLVGLFVLDNVGRIRR